MAVGDSFQPPWPLVEIAIEAKHRADRDNLGLALRTLAAEDPSFRASTDGESGQTIIKGVDERHLDGKVDILRRLHDIDVSVGTPQVAYRETLMHRVEQDHTHKRQSGGIGQFARVKIVVEPNETDAGNIFESKIVGGAVPEDYAAGVEVGIDDVMRSGILAGFPLVDVRVTLIDSAYHDVDSSAETFTMASRTAFREALQRGGLVLLEPIMMIELVTPENYVGPIIADLEARRCAAIERGRRGRDAHITTLAPLACMLGYASPLRSLSQGRATFTMRFALYRPVPSKDGGRPPPAAAAVLRA